MIQLLSIKLFFHVLENNPSWSNCESCRADMAQIAFSTNHLAMHFQWFAMERYGFSQTRRKLVEVAIDINWSLLSNHGELHITWFNIYFWISSKWFLFSIWTYKIFLVLYLIGNHCIVPASFSEYDFFCKTKLNNAMQSTKLTNKFKI